MMNTQRSDSEKKSNWRRHKIGIDEVIKHNEIINKSLKSQIENNVILLLKV